MDLPPKTCDNHDPQDPLLGSGNQKTVVLILPSPARPEGPNHSAAPLSEPPINAVVSPVKIIFYQD
ncbi:hypothetical protein FA95DRAFT_714403 [Auriscalpium vulgare]|uniref:Uncharacterized protein n=1 Tax=Auriscalpium vulgare TaxID=40419 RepID=A0ACB8RCB7_9AGAM|nr:hypothetical protein FA95DRAFT_714403 [Auriscalpium vulgare]